MLGCPCCMDVNKREEMASCCSAEEVGGEGCSSSPAAATVHTRPLCELSPLKLGQDHIFSSLHPSFSLGKLIWYQESRCYSPSSLSRPPKKKKDTSESKLAQTFWKKSCQRCRQVMLMGSACHTWGDWRPRNPFPARDSVPEVCHLAVIKIPARRKLHFHQNPPQQPLPSHVVGKAVVPQTKQLLTHQRDRKDKVGWCHLLPPARGAPHLINRMGSAATFKQSSSGIKKLVAISYNKILSNV